MRFDPWVRKIPQRRAQQPTPVFLPGESHGQKSLAGYSPQGRIESDTTEATQHAHKRDTRRVSKSFQVVPGAKNLPTIQEMEEMWVQHLSGEDLLEEERATHSSIITRKIPWTKEPAALQSMGLQRVGHNCASIPSKGVIKSQNIREN